MKRQFHSGAGRRRFLSLVAVLASGSALSTSCDSKVRIAVVSGLESTFMSLFDPTNFLNTSSTDATGSFQP